MERTPCERKESKRQKNRRKVQQRVISRKKKKKRRGHGSRDVKGKQDTDRINERTRETGHL